VIVDNAYRRLEKSPNNKVSRFGEGFRLEYCLQTGNCNLSHGLLHPCNELDVVMALGTYVQLKNFFEDTQ